MIKEAGGTSSGRSATASGSGASGSRDNAAAATSSRILTAVNFVLTY